MTSPPLGASRPCVPLSPSGWGRDTPGAVWAAVGRRGRSFGWTFYTKPGPRPLCERGAGIRAGVKIVASPLHSGRQCRPHKGFSAFCAFSHLASKSGIKKPKSVTEWKFLRAASTIQGVNPEYAPFMLQYQCWRPTHRSIPTHKEVGYDRHERTVFFTDRTGNR